MIETAVVLTATEHHVPLDTAAVVAALAEDLGVDAERITVVPLFDLLDAGAEADVKVLVEVEDAAAVEAVEEKLGALERETDVFGASFEVKRVAEVFVTRPAPSSPPPADVCDCDADAASDECKETCDAIGAAAGIIGAALILAIVLPIVGCLLVALLVALVVYCCCCKKAAAGAPAQPTAVEITKTAV